jgi:hypothetical protein
MMFCGMCSDCGWLGCAEVAVPVAADLAVAVQKQDPDQSSRHNVTLLPWANQQITAADLFPTKQQQH